MNIVLFDFDIVAYRCGYAAEKRRYTAKDGTLEFDTKEEALKHDPEPQILIKPDPLGNALHSVKSICNRILEKLKPVESYRGYLTGSDNFRHKIATIKPYKGNRKNVIKPTWYADIREYLVKNWHAEVVNGIEADDQLVIDFLKNPKKSIICSIDKDFNQVPNVRLYNWVKEEFNTIDRQQAAFNLWKQVLTGDSTDNIPGVPKIGERKAEKLLASVRSIDQYHDICLKEYQKHYKDQAEQVMLENYNLVYLLRTEKEAMDRRTKYGATTTQISD